jgi:uncharacterized repeat protein (TIGR03837 family)
MQLHWDIFCRVIDNYGDIGVCWRLARQLAAEHGKAVRLWVDDPASLTPLCPDVDATVPRQTVQGVEIRHWRPESVVTASAAAEADEAVDRVAEVVIEAFACELPAAYVAAMAAAPRRPCWINLEYLTAEDWAANCHGLASPHPTLPLVKYFFFPGFSASTGGLLRENTLRFFEPPPSATPLEISLFCYETAPLAGLLEAFAAAPSPLRCLVAAGKPQAALRALLGGPGPWQVGATQLLPLPFLPLDEYDALLRRCDLNFVRGEDSFVRAQWAGRPFIWQIYRQEDDAHLVKLQAFIDRYTAAAEPALADLLRQTFSAWNTAASLAGAWPALLAALPEIQRHNEAWRAALRQMPDLATALVNFSRGKV